MREFLRQINQLVLLATLWLGALCATGYTPCVAADEVLITQANNAMSKLSLTSARAVFCMRLTSWPDGTPIHVFVLPDRHSAHNNFTRQKLNMFPYQLRREWDRQVYSGVGAAPTEVPDAKTMRMMVAETPGAIGYLNESEVDGTVQILQIK